MKIIADTPTLYSPEEGRELNLTIVPACTIIGDKVYKDFEDINSEEFLKLIEEGAVPTTSQPAIGDMLDVFEESNEEALVLTIGDGLSGTYQTALGAKNSIEENEHIHVVDTKTLAGPQRYLVQKAMKLREEGIGIERIKEELIKCIETSVSFVIPEDFEFLKRSGRLTPIAAKLATIIKIVPVLTQTEDKKRITLFTVKRSKKKALESIMDYLEALGMNKEYFVSVSHAGTPEAAAHTLDRLKERFAGIHADIFQLAPALITHGGPGCVVIQAIHK